MFEIKRSKKLLIFGLIDLLFAFLYLYIFIFILPAYDVTARILTISAPLLLLLSGVYMVAGFPKASEVAVWISVFFLTLALFLIIVFTFTIGYFRGIYGPFGHGITIISYIAIALIIEFLCIWPVIQIYAFWSRTKSIKSVKKSIRFDTSEKTEDERKPSETEKVSDKQKVAEDKSNEVSK